MLPRLQTLLQMNVVMELLKWKRKESDCEIMPCLNKQCSYLFDEHLIKHYSHYLAKLLVLVYIKVNNVALGIHVRGLCIGR